MSKRPVRHPFTFFQRVKKRLPLGGVGSMQVFQVLQFGTAILIGILLAKSGLPTGLISVYEALMFIASLFVFFWVVGGQNTILQLYPKLGEETRPRALFTVFLLFTLAGLASGGVLFLSKNIVAQRLTNFTELPYLDLLALFLVFNSPTFLIQIFYLLLKKFREIVVFGVVSFGLQLTVVVAPIYLGRSLREVMIGLVGWAIFKFAWGIVLLARHARWQWDPVFLKMYLPLVLPLMLLAFVGKGSEYVSGLIVTSLFEDEKAFAVFRYGARELPLAVLMVSALATSLIPEVSADPAAGLRRVRETTRRLSHLLFPLSMASMLVAPLLFPVIFNPDFKASATVFNIFTLLLASRILLPQVVAMGHGKNYVLTLSALVELAVLAALSWWWGQAFGLQGVAYAAAASYFVNRVLLIWYNWKVLGIPPGQYVAWRTYTGYTVLLAVVFLISLQL